MKKFNLIKRLFMDSHEKQSPQRFFRYAAMLIMLLTLGVGQAWAASEGSNWYDASSAKVYFDNTNSSYSNVSILIGRQWNYGSDGVGSSGTNLSKISGTNNLYYASVSFTKYTTFCFIDATNWGWEGNKVTARCTYASHYTNTPNDNLGSSTHLYVPASSSNNASVTHTTPSSYTSLNYTQTLNQTLSTDGGSTFSTSTASIATVKVQANKLNGNSSTTDNSGTIDSGESSTSCSAARTATVTYTVSSVATDYEFVGWYDGSTQKSTSTTYTYNATEAKTITARFKQKQYTVSYGVNSSTRWGSIKLNSGSAVTTTSSSTLNHGTAISFTATPNSGYQVEGWYSDASCTAVNRLQSGGTSYDAGTLTAATTVYVKFEARTGGVVTLNAGSNGQVSLDNSNWGTSKTKSSITTNTAFNIYAQGNTGYHFSSWSKTSGSGTIGSTSTANTTFTPVAYEDAILSATFAETMSTLSTSCSYDVGNPSYAAPAVTGSYTTVGYATTRTITATAAGTGYTFTGWTLTNCTRTDGGAANATSITIRSNGDGADVSVVANYNEVLTTVWYLTGSLNSWSATANKFAKRSGESTGSVAYTTIDLAENTHYEFGVNNGSDYYANNNGSSEDYYIKGTVENWTFNRNLGYGINCHIKTTLAGTYTFKIDYSGSNPLISVYYPEVYAISGDFNSWTEETNLVFSGNDGSYEVSIDGSSTNYEFKVLDNGSWYGHTNKTFTGTESNVTLTTPNNNIKLTADVYPGGTYTFAYNKSTHKLGVTYPANFVVNFGKRTGGNTVTAKINNVTSFNDGTKIASGTSVTFSQSANAGYIFEGWYNAASGGTRVSTSASYTTTISAATTIYANYTENTTAITITTDGHGTITTPSPNNSPYSLGVATMQAINASPNTGYNWNRWEVSGNAALNSSATTQSNKAKGNGTNGGTGTITATFTPKQTTITLNNQDATTPGSTSVTATYDAEMPAITLPTKTGYTFGGYWGAPGGSGPQYYNADGSSAANWNNEISTYTLFAKWTPKTYTVTLDYDETHHGDITTTPPTGSVTATYDAAMPAIAILPKAAEGYAFMGYYSAAGGSGTQYYDGTGASVTNWNVDDEITLYAYYKQAEITSVTFDNAVVEPNATITATANIDPDPAGTTTVCWRLLHDNGNEYTPQPTFTPASGATVSFRAPETSTHYKVEAKLRTGNDCSGGTLLDSEIGRFQVAGSHTVTVNYKCGDDVIKAATSVTATPLDWSGDITAPDIFGYTFARWDAADGVTIKNGDSDPVTTTTNATIQIMATYNGKLTAVYTQKSMIFFKNTLGWEDVYVNFYTGSYWNNPKGSGNQSVTNRNKHMSQLDDTDIWYYDYGAASITPSLYVSFTSASQDGSEFFWKSGGVNVVYPANYPDAINTDKSSENGFKAATPMFVPLATQDKVTLNSSSGGKADYYNAGYWTKYTPGTGYRLEIYNNGTGAFIKAQDFTSADDLMPMKATVDLEGGTTYKFQLRRGGESSAGIYYGNSGTMTYADHGQGTPWDMTNAPLTMCRITTNAAGDYTFNLSYSGNSSTPPHYRLRMAVDYPVADGDYRLVYSDAVQTKPLTSAIVNKVNDGSDTVSFFVRPGSTPVLRIQQASIDGSTVTWKEYPTIGMPTNQIAGAIATALTSGGTDVYNFNLAMNGSGELSVASVEKYDGNYYIRTDAANNKWDNYRTDPDHRMTYSEYSITHGGYTHYYTHWVNKDDVGRKNVKFVIANDYSPNISDTLTRETASGTWTNIDKFIETGGDLKRSANVRFMWDKRSNAISRAYVDGAQGDYSSNFLYMLNVEGGADKIKKEDGTALTDHKVTFKDNGNWMYEANIKAQPTAQIKLLSNWGKSPTITQYFRGASDATETLIGGSGSNWYDIRLIYDFKTNRLIAGLIPSGTIDEQMAIHADVMFIREHHGDIAQLTFAEKDSKMGAITDIETAYGVLQLNKWTLNNKSKADGHAPLSPLLSQYERDLFYISFPFRVSMEEVFGFGTYGQHWIIEEYDGASRAANGYWQESGPNWKFVFNRKNKFFEPGTGYIIALDLDEMKESSDVWTNTDQVELYFPSYGTMDNITSSTATYNIPAHLCTINRSNEPKPGGGTLGSAYDRRVKDSHWNVLGVPTYVNPEAPEFANTDWITTATETSVGPNFLYEWNMDDNSVSAVSASGYTYHAMHAYLVQYCGDVTWSSSVSVKPSPIVARRTYDGAPKSIEFRLELMQDAQAIDQTFVKLSDNEAVTTGFEFNYDLSKEFNNNKANIYTLIGTEQVAGNVLPLTEQTTVVPVGVKIATNGDYTFSMPDGTEGIGVTLIDNETGIRTSLSALDYTVFLEAGTYEGRFIIEISPLVGVWTDVENVQSDEEQSTKARKMIIDQQMYIIKDGKVYDAQGARIK